MVISLCRVLLTLLINTHELSSRIRQIARFDVPLSARERCNPKQLQQEESHAHKFSTRTEIWV